MTTVTEQGAQNFSLPAINQNMNIPNFNLPDFRPNWHQLIIIGNGFDLECGLPSGFSSYINARNIDLRECKGDEARSYTLTIWDTILESMPNANWCDIEGAISNWMAPDGFEPLSEGTLFSKCLNFLVNHDPTEFDSKNVEKVVAFQLFHRLPNHWCHWTISSLLIEP